VLEKGFLQRDLYFHAGWDGLNGRANFVNMFSPEDRFEKLGVELKPRRASLFTEPVVVCGQVPWDATVEGTDHEKWCQFAIDYVRRYTRRPVLFRPHPAVGQAEAAKVYGFSILPPMCVEPLEEVLTFAHALVTFNSSTACHAVVEGACVFAVDDGSMAYEVCQHDLAKVDRCEHVSDEQLGVWARNLAYAQWNLEELSSGETWRHLRGLFEYEW